MHVLTVFYATESAGYAARWLLPYAYTHPVVHNWIVQLIAYTADTWGKLQPMLDMLPEYDYIMFLDSDACAL